ncbi:MAG TPA: M23 family metallopeptidase, partial [Candidatus Hydrogenedentes bacterium]|nr:M23 family metallopeptidase [Candidatus Hydrogenedentota bacterium]
MMHSTNRHAGRERRGMVPRVSCLLLMAFTVAAGRAGAEDAYCWPLDLPRLLTSSFAEYRAGRFHAGIDLRTSGIGRDVRAPADGYVSRLRCSPWGYGKAVYLQLDDGHTVVFGHLDAFAEPLAQYVRDAQHAAERYTVDLY